MINFKSENKGTWFYFDEDNHDFGGICLRLVTAAEYDDIRRLTVKAGKPDYHRGQRYETEKTNSRLSMRLSLQKFIVDWKEVSLDGILMECTNENKEKMTKVNDFQLFLGECIDKLTEGNKTLEEARVKNLEDIVGGDVETSAVETA